MTHGERPPAVGRHAMIASRDRDCLGRRRAIHAGPRGVNIAGHDPAEGARMRLRVAGLSAHMPRRLVAVRCDDTGRAILLSSDVMSVPPVHVPVLPAEVLHWLDPQPGQIIVDGTLGGGGHTRLDRRTFWRAGSVSSR